MREKNFFLVIVFLFSILLICQPAATQVKKSVPADSILFNDRAAAEVVTPSAGKYDWFIDAGTSKVKLPNGTVKSILDSAVTASDLPNGLITFAKFQPINTEQILGRDTAGTGNVEALNLGTNLTISGGALNATGSVTGVGLIMPDDFSVNSSPVTSFGSLGVNWVDVPANTFLAGATSGGVSEPDFRAIASADIATALLTPGPIGTTTPNRAAFTGVAKSVVVVTTDLTLNNTHNLVLVDSTSGIRTITLPLANAFGAGNSQEIIIVGLVADLNNVSIVRQGSDTINGSATPTGLVSESEFMMLRSNGVDNWIILARGVP